MTRREIARWSLNASEAQIMSVRQAGVCARDLWLDLMTEADEYADCRDLWRGNLLTVRMASEAAGDATVEMAIVCAIWPGRVDIALGR